LSRTITEGPVKNVTYLLRDCYLLSVYIIIIIKNVLIKVTLSQYAAGALSNKKET